MNYIDLTEEEQEEFEREKGEPIDPENLFDEDADD